MKLRKWASVLLAGCLVAALAGCTKQQTEESSREEQETVQYAFGEKAPIMVIDENEEEKLVGYLTIDSVRLTDSRLPDEEHSPEQVAVVRYTYENVDIESGMMISSVQFNVLDGEGNPCEGYPMTADEYLPSVVEKSESGTAAHTAEQCYVLEKGSDIVIEYRHILTTQKPLLSFYGTVE